MSLSPYAANAPEMKKETPLMIVRVDSFRPNHRGEAKQKSSRDPKEIKFAKMLKTNRQMSQPCAVKIVYVQNTCKRNEC
jgi:hypothetical protein